MGAPSSIERIDALTVERIASDASRAGSVVGVRTAEIADDEDAAPWARAIREGAITAITEPLPDRVSAVLAQRLFVAKAGLPSPLLDQIKRIAAFQNPEFYKKQNLRLSTALTPWVISCAEDLPQHVALPRGCTTDLEELLRGLGVALDIVDERVSGEPLALRFLGTLSPVQDEAVRALLAHNCGVLVAPPGFGKTVIGAFLVAARACNTLVLVHRKPLLDQWRAQLAVFLGIDPREIGQIGAGKRNPTGRIDVAMIQSLVRKESVADLVAGYGQVIVDECHHLPAVSFERVLASAKARYVTGLTATPQRRDGRHPIIQMQLGPVRFTMNARTQASQRPFEHRLIVRETGFRPSTAALDVGIQGLYGALAQDETRNAMILNDVIGTLAEGGSPILLTERRDHLEYFANKLRPFARHLIVLQGGMGAKTSRDARDRLAAIPATEERLLLATGRYIGEGFDDSRLDTLFLALPVSWKGTLVQYTGRLHRLHPGKRDIRIFDYVDRDVPMLLRMFEKRLRGYRAIGYARGRRRSATPSRTKPRSSTTRTRWPNATATTTLLERDVYMPLRNPARKTSNTPSPISKARLAAMIEEATIDAYGDSEQTTGWYTMLDEHLALPFETKVLGVVVTVARLDLRGEDEIVAICTRGCEQQVAPSSICPYRGPSPLGPMDRRVPILGRRLTKAAGWRSRATPPRCCTGLSTCGFSRHSSCDNGPITTR